MCPPPDLQTQPPRTALAHVVVNAGSGGGCTQDWADGLAARLQARGMQARVQLARSGEQVLAGVDEALREGASLVVAGGGDGTISAAASRLCGTDVVLGVLPLGTLNHFAKDLQLPLDLDPALDVLAHGRVAQVDVGEVNGHVFVNNSSIGLYPDVVLERERQRRRLGRGKWRALASASLHALRRYPVLAMQLEVDGAPLQRRSAFLFVGNNDYSMEGFEIGARASLQGGRLSLYVTHHTGRFGLVALALRALLHRLQQAQDFDMLSAREAVVHTRERRLRVATDGEVVVLDTPLRYRIRPGALRVLVPPREAG